MAYDSAPSTLEHVARVRELLLTVAEELTKRAVEHDASKLGPEEKPLFDRMTPRLAEAAYGSPEYAAALRELRPALEHHYSANRHHPEHFPEGWRGMSLIDLLEMVVDWKAAGERDGGTGDLRESIMRNFDRIHLDEGIVAILLNTAEALEDA